MMPEGERPRRWLLAALAVVVAACAAAPDPASVQPGAAASPSPAASPVASPVPAVASPSPAHPAPTPDLVTPGPRDSPDPARSWIVDPLPRRTLQRRLTALAQRWHLPGVSVTIRWPDGREWTGTAGVADVTDRRAVTDDTAFALASISKTYTAANALKLMEEGRLKLDDRAARYLPQLKLDPRITIRMLLDHTSGLPDFFLNATIDRPLQGKPDQRWTVTRTWKYVRKPLFAPGTRWSYSNTNYLLLGLIEEAADGRPLAIQLRARFFDPLGLTETWSQAVEPAPDGLAFARGHRLLGTGKATKSLPVFDGGSIMPFRSVITAAGAAGGIGATSRDAARWMEALVLGDVLKPGTKLQMLSESIYTDALGARIPYGLGIQVVRLRDRVAIGHSGRLLGFRGVVRVLPDEGMTIAVLTNQGTVDPSLLAASMLKGMLPRSVDCTGPCPTIQ